MALGTIGPGGILLAIVALLIWIIILVWLSERVLRFVGMRSGWRPLDLRNLAVTVLLLVGAIHMGNYLLDLLERAMRDGSYVVQLGYPSAFLIGSVAIGTGIAAVRWHRKQNLRNRGAK